MVKKTKTSKKAAVGKHNDESSPKGSGSSKKMLLDLGLTIAILLALLSLIHRGKDGVWFIINEERTNVSVSTTANTTKNNDDTAAINGFLNCLERRGNSGTWVLDWDYANQTDYTMLGSYSGNWHVANEIFRPSPGHPFRSATAWKWQDDHCPVHLLTHPETFCQVSRQLNISRYAILGDSMSCQFFMSLLHLLQMNIPKRRTTFRGIMRPFVLNCPGDYQIKLWNWRFSPLSDLQNNLPLSEDHGLRYFINHQDGGDDDNDKTAIVFNTGLWMPTQADFQLGFQAYIDWIDTFDPDKMLVFWRPTIPGHVDCQPRPIGAINHTQAVDWTLEYELEDRPYTDYEDYQQTTQSIMRTNPNTSTYNWFQIERYNHYSRVVLQKREEEALLNVSSNQPNRAHIHWLNIFPSSILRRDGHVGFVDCVHYNLPGPTDWWVHFFFSMLRDISTGY